MPIHHSKMLRPGAKWLPPCLYFGNVCIYSVPGLTCNWRTVMAKAKKKAKKKAAKKK